MLIKGLGRTKVKDTYGRGDTVRFRQDFARLKKVEVEKGGGDVEKVLLRLAKVDNADDFNMLFNVLADTDAEYVDLDDFLGEMRTMRRDWGGQKVFYEKPTGAKKAPALPDVKWQEGRVVRLYSAREAEDIKNLYVWAQQKGIKTEGFDRYAHLAETKDVSAQQPRHQRPPLRGEGDLQPEGLGVPRLDPRLPHMVAVIALVVPGSMAMEGVTTQSVLEPTDGPLP